MLAGLLVSVLLGPFGNLFNFIFCLLLRMNFTLSNELANKQIGGKGNGAQIVMYRLLSVLGDCAMRSGFKLYEIDAFIP